MKKINVRAEHCDCDDKECSFRHGCACHSSALGLQMVGGFTPRIFVETKTNEFFCETATRPFLMIPDMVIPDDITELGRGFEPIRYKKELTETE